MQVHIASITSKGQFTIPQPIRAALRLSAGSKMVLICDGKHLLMKPIQPGDTAAYKELITEAEKLERQTSRKSKKGGKP